MYKGHDRVLLSAIGISKAFGTYQALHNVSFSVQRGEILGLIGPNGAGKSTLFECIAGLLPTDSGRVQSGHQTLLPTQRKEVLWYQPDNTEPFGQQQIFTTLSFFQTVHGASQQTLDQLLYRLELSTMLHKPFKALSKGFQRRVLLCIALLSRRKVLLLDEPFDGFDVRQSLAIMELLGEYKEDRAMILSIHQLSEAEKICDRFLLLDQGCVLGYGTLAELRLQAALAENASLEEVFLAIT